jgi:hypothetical protein
MTKINSKKNLPMNEFAKKERRSDICIAGSSALWRLHGILNGKSPNWKPKDTDIFLLGSSSDNRFYKTDYNLDIVHSTSKTCQDLILAFDLPCCRVAYDFNFTFYVSIQTLAAIFSGKMYLPKYFETELQFKQILDKHSTIKKDWEKNTFIPNFYYNKLAKRLQERIKKYRSRGYAPKYYDTEYILPWIKERFKYSEKKFETQKQQKINIKQSPPRKRKKKKFSDEYLDELKINTLTLEIAKMTGRKVKFVVNRVAKLFKEWDITTIEDWVLLDESQVMDALNLVKSVPIQNALVKIHATFLK